MSRLARDGTVEQVSRDQVLRRQRAQRNIHFPCSADHEQDWQPYPVDPYSAISYDNTYIHTAHAYKRTYTLKVTAASVHRFHKLISYSSSITEKSLPRLRLRHGPGIRFTGLLVLRIYKMPGIITNDKRVTIY